MLRPGKITFFQKTFCQKDKIGHFKNVQKPFFQKSFGEKKMIIIIEYLVCRFRSLFRI